MVSVIGHVTDHISQTFSIMMMMLRLMMIIMIKFHKISKSEKKIILKVYGINQQSKWLSAQWMPYQNIFSIFHLSITKYHIAWIHTYSTPLAHPRLLRRT